MNAADPAQVREALVAYVADHLGLSGFSYLQEPTPIGRGMDTRIYSFQLNADGLGPQWSARLVLRLYTSADRNGRALWNIASAAGLRVGVVNWWTTHPAEIVRA